jgi:hypothetical protein
VDQARNADELGRQLRKAVVLRLGQFGGRQIALSPVQVRQLAPRREQRVVEIHGALIGRRRAPEIPEQLEVVAFLLPSAGVGRLLRLQPFQRFQGLRGLVQVAQCHGLDVERLGIRGVFEQFGPGCLQGFLQPAALQQLPGPAGRIRGFLGRASRVRLRHDCRNTAATSAAAPGVRAGRRFRNSHT